MDNSTAMAKAEISGRIFKSAIEAASKEYNEKIFQACSGIPDIVTIKATTKAYVELVNLMCDDLVKIVSCSEPKPDDSSKVQIITDNSLDSIISAIEHGQDPLQSSPQNSTSNNSGLTSENRDAQGHGTQGLNRMN